MRKNVNDTVEVVNGDGILASAKITSIAKSKASLKIESLEKHKEPNTKLILIQPLIKFSNLELVLEKCTELGADEFWIYKADKSENLTITENRKQRFLNFLISSLKQSGRLFLPKVKYFDSLKDLTNIEGNLFFGSLAKDSNPLKDSISSKNLDNKNSYFAIGPESGFSKDEEAYLENTLKGKKVTISKNILRSETASIAAITAIQCLLIETQGL